MDEVFGKMLSLAFGTPKSGTLCLQRKGWEETEARVGRAAGSRRFTES